MFRNSRMPPFACALALLLASAPGAAETPKPAAAKTATPKSGRMTVNGVDYYYEVHGRR